MCKYLCLHLDLMCMAKLRFLIPAFLLFFVCMANVSQANPSVFYEAGLRDAAKPGAGNPDTLELNAGSGQGIADDFFIMAEDTLKKLALEIIKPADDSSRIQNNLAFMSCLQEVLISEGAFDYPFDSLETVSILHSPDSDFRVITWYVPLSFQQFRYFGFLQIREENAPSYRLIELHDSTLVIDHAVFSELTHDRWYGAYYYDIIVNQSDEGMIYTLLGWKGDNPETRKRVIEPLVFREGMPIFGARVFDIGQHDPYRIVFEYSSRVSMSLLYDAHMLRGEVVPMILFDRLSPFDESQRGQYRFYVPEGNIFDALVFRSGKWVFEQDVDARSRIRPRTSD